jgi:hypothetical protein
VRYEEVGRYLRALNLLRHELASIRPQMERELRSHLVGARDSISERRAVDRCFDIISREPEACRLFQEVLSRVDPDLPIPEALRPEPQPPPPFYPGSAPTVGAPMPNTGSFGPLAGDVTPTPALDLVCPNDPSHPGARIGFLNRLVPPTCPYCRVRLVDRRGLG